VRPRSATHQPQLTPLEPRSATLEPGLSILDAKSAVINQRRSVSSDRLTNRILSRPDLVLFSGRSWQSQGRIKTTEDDLIKGTKDDLIDRKWLSSEKLVDKWECPDKWWLDNTTDKWLDTDKFTFGRKTVFLVDLKKDGFSTSVPDLSIGEEGISIERPKTSME